MSKKSKSCGYTGHMHTMNLVNENKIAYQTNAAKNHALHANMPVNHCKHKPDYPEVAAENRAQAQCHCTQCNCTQSKRHEN